MKYKRIVLALTALCFLCGCSAADEKDEETAETAAETSEPESLSDRWENFRGNMPNDKNMEDDLRDSDYISELKRFMSSDEGFSVKYEELSKATGINDNELIERTNGGWTARVIYFGPDIINMAVTDASVANKYVFLQMTNGVEKYFMTACDGGYEFPVDLLLFNDNGLPTAVVVSRYATSYPEGAILEAYTIVNGEIETTEIFGEYSPEGIKTEKFGGGVLFESGYEDGTAVGDIQRLGVSVDQNSGDIILSHGENTFIFSFDGEKYIMNRSE